MRTYTARLALALSLLWPAGAAAWADARLAAVAAELDVTSGAAARVTLDLTLRVRAGSPERFDLVDLARDLVLLEPLTVRGPDGAIALPELTSREPGSLTMTWPSGRGPARGDHQLRVVYSTQQLRAAAPGASPERRVAWRMPRWPVRLAGVEVRVVGPAGTRPWRSAEHPNQGETVRVERAGARQVLTYQRAELPRTETWLVQFELPYGAAAAEVQPTRSRPDTFGPSRALRAAAWPALLGALLGALVVAKRRLTVAPGGQRWADERWLDALAFALCTAAGALARTQHALALVCALSGVGCALMGRAAQLAASRGAGRSPAAVSGEPAAPTARTGLHRWFATRVRGPAWLDATTPAGVLALGLLTGAATLSPESLRTLALLATWLAVPLFLTSTRLHAR